MASPVTLMYHILTSFGLLGSNVNNPLVETRNGILEGTVSYSREGHKYLQFLGVPYAKPPVNELRFEPPQPAEKWLGIRKANNYGPLCMQFEAFTKAKPLGDEDCLYLNVFQKVVKENHEKRLPVMVYIHGGGFTAGSALDYSPKYFMDEDVIIVTINYRLGALGFLNTGDDVVRGNMGLKDQNLALKWVRDNIKYFNGDPQQVTIFGESAGAASVHYHILSPLSKGLFHKAILQSGSALCPWAFTRNAGHQAKRFAKNLNCPTDNTSVLVACLKNMNPIKLVHPHSAIMSPIHLQDDLFVGSVEVTKTNDTFLSVNPFHLLSTGDFHKVPIILGINAGEGGLKTSRLEAFPEILNKIDEKWDEYIPILLHYDPARKDISEKIREYYFQNSTNISKDVATLTKMISDGIFFHAAHWTAKLHSKYAPVYLYYYTYRSSLPSVYSAIGAVKNSDDQAYSDFKLINAIIRDYLRQYFQQSKDPKRFGPCHGEELLLLWDMHWASEIGTLGTDFVFSKALISSLVSFAKSIENLRFRTISWPSVNKTSNDLIYMELNKTPRTIEEPFKSSMIFWDSLDIRNTQDNHNW